MKNVILMLLFFTCFNGVIASANTCTICCKSLSTGAVFPTTQGDYAHMYCYNLIHQPYEKHVLAHVKNMVSEKGVPHYDLQTKIHASFVQLLLNKLEEYGYASIHDFAKAAPDYDVQDLFQRLARKAVKEVTKNLTVFMHNK